MEHRWGTRQPADVKVRFVSPAKFGTGRLLNISVTGAFMKTKVHLRLLAVVDLLPAAPGSRTKKPKRLAACVVRRDAAGVGLEWCESLAGRSGIAHCLSFLTGGTDAVEIPPTDAAADVNQTPERARRAPEEVL